MAFTASNFQLPNPASDIFEKISRIPQLGGVITFGIDTMVHLFSSIPGVAVDQASKASEKAFSVILFIVLAAIIGAITAWVLRRTKIAAAYVGFLVVLIPLVITLLVEGFNTGNANGSLTGSGWVILMYGAWAMILGTVLEGWSYLSRPTAVPASAAAATIAGTTPTVVNAGRRNFLISTAGSAAALTVLASGAGKLFTIGSSNQNPVVASGPTETPTPMPAVGTAEGTAGAEAVFVPAPGTRAETTPNNNFYRVDVNLDPPRVDSATWTLLVGGLVDNTYSLSYSALRDLPATEQDATLECISNPVGGDLMSSTHWTGVKLADLLNKAGVKSGVAEIMFTCTDGYTESLPLESAMDPRTLIAYANNGQALLPEHGFPVRLYTPNRYGMKNPKWITKIEAIAQPVDGYWTQRGWDKQAIVKTTSIIDVIDTDKVTNGIVPIGGVAFAGSREISKVEIQIDDGAWQTAVLKPELSKLTWRLWRFDWKADKGHYNVTVRATDGQGALQISDTAPLHPNGASGYVSDTADVI